jgi:tyrosyl-tRNA synthetase
MSKSLNNFIGIDEKPEEMFGKIMSISDELMWRWFELLSFISEKEIKDLKQQVDEGSNPRDIKFILADELVDRFHGTGNGVICKEIFLKRFQKGSLPEEIKEISIQIDASSIPLTNLLKNTEMTSSTSEAMRLIKQGGVKIDLEKVLDPKLEIKSGSEAIYQVGKRKFLKIKIT